MNLATFSRELFNISVTECAWKVIFVGTIHPYLPRGIGKLVWYWYNSSTKPLKENVHCFDSGKKVTILCFQCGRPLRSDYVRTPNYGRNPALPGISASSRTGPWLSVGPGRTGRRWRQCHIWPVIGRLVSKFEKNLKIFKGARSFQYPIRRLMRTVTHKKSQTREIGR